MLENENQLESATDVETSQEEAAQPTSAAEPIEKTPQYNFAELRQKTLKIERERDEALRKLADLEASKNQSSEDYSLNIAESDLAEGKHVKVLEKKIERLEKQLGTYQQMSSDEIVEAKLRATYPDLDKVLSKDNVTMLAEIEPELAQTLRNSKDTRSNLIVAYKAIKDKGIYKEDIYSADRERAQKNLSKPRPLTSVSPQQGDSPLSHANAFANGLTPDLQKQLLKEMTEAMKNR